MTKEYKHVYCTDCKHGWWIPLMHIINPKYILPKSCKTCYPYDVVDSREKSIKVNYKEKKLPRDKT